MLRSDCIALTGAGDLYGVALEGSVKLWEMLQVPAMGYELDEVMHGPNFGFNSRHCVFRSVDARGNIVGKTINSASGLVYKITDPAGQAAN